MRTSAIEDSLAARLRGRSVLVTGGAGFIGSHLVDALVAAGAAVRVLDDLSTGLRSNLAAVADRIELIEESITSRQALAQACCDVELVFHEAALGSVPRSMADPAATIEVNVSGTAHVLAAARAAGVRRVVYASSSSIYGDSLVLPRREGEEGRALSPYALSKQMVEQLAEQFEQCFGFETVGLRYFNVYGARQRPDGPYAAVIPRFFAAARAGERPLIFGDGGQSRDFTFVADAVSANLLAAMAPRTACGRAFNVGSGCATTIGALAAAVRALAGGGAPIHEPARSGDVRHAVADLEEISTALDYFPRVGLEQGLAAIADSDGDTQVAAVMLE